VQSRCPELGDVRWKEESREHTRRQTEALEDAVVKAEEANKIARGAKYWAGVAVFIATCAFLFSLYQWITSVVSVYAP